MVVNGRRYGDKKLNGRPRINANMVAAWPFDSGGPTWTDAVGGLVLGNGTGTSTQAMVIGNGIIVEDSDNPPNLTSNVFNFSGSFTISGWYNAGSASDLVNIIKYDASGSTKFLFGLDPNSGFIVWKVWDYTASLYYAYLDAIPAADENHFFSVYYDHTALQIGLSIDGGDYQVAAADTIYDAPGGILTVCDHNSGSTDHVSMDQLEFRSRVLTLEDARDVMAAHRAKRAYPY